MPRFIGLFLACFLHFSIAYALPLKPENVPQPLQAWVDWVLADEEDYPCPVWYNRNEQKNCVWSGQLRLELNAQQGQFASSWQVYKEGWIALPGDEKHWPLHVTANDKPLAVLNHDNVPVVKLAVGTYRIQGQFLWDSIPESLTIPENSGLIDLTINGKSVAMPAIKSGSIWLKESDIGQKKPQAIENKLDLQIFRQVDDDVPLQLITFLELEVSGQQREIKLPHALLTNFIPSKLISPLPARIEADGSLSLQVRAGRWHLELYARHPNLLTELGLSFTDKTWPKSEIWVFNARPYQRLVEIENLTAIDPSQTNLPDAWKNLPAYQVQQGEKLHFKVIRRGDPEPEPNHLSLERTLWLDFAGTGYTIQDQISGKMSNGWRLNALPAMQLGRVKLNGEGQLITQLANAQQGVEVRQGQIDLKADSRLIGSVGNINAVGWEQSFHQVKANLMLPPGWKLLAVSGVDNVPDSWISNWTLLDIFLVLIISIIIWQLWNPYWGGFALLTLTLSWHEADAPQFIWLNILAALALLRVLPDNKFSMFIRWYRNLCWLSLVLIVLPFLVTQVRIGLYPQLEKPWQSITSEPEQPASAAPAEPVQTEEAQATATDVEDIPEAAPAPIQQQAIQKEATVDAKLKADADAKYKISNRSLMNNTNNYYAQKSLNFNQIDPNANVQTGVGSPQWQWNTVELSWNGTVDQHQELSFWYLSPLMTLMLNFLRVIFVSVLALLLFGGVDKWRSYLPFALNICLVLLLGLPTQKTYADFPPQAVLDELKARLLEEPDCLPHCADISSMKVLMTPEKMSLNLQVQAQQTVALPLPALYKEWMPNQVTLDGQLATAMMRDENGALWLTVNAGQHQVELSGLTPAHAKFTLPLPLKPHYVSTETTGWSIEGVHENGEAEEQLQFNRVQSDALNTVQALEQAALPAFIQVERTLELGLDWRMTTRINRVIPSDVPVLMELNLLKGEAVTTPNIRVKQGKVQVNMAANDSSLQWESVLEKSPTLELIAPKTSQWTEIWRADVSPMWHLQSEGISVVHHQNPEVYWLPEWRPWAGEKVRLSITRPVAIAGRTLTIDNSRLTVKSGKRSQEVNLTMTLRSSKGTQHTITLPEQASLQSVLINGITQPIRQKANQVTLPIKPGSQNLTLNWLQLHAQSGFLQTPKVNLGMDSVNTHLTILLGTDRWVLLTTGPRFGPAVLFWGVLLVLAGVAVGLGKIRLTPLKHWQWFLLLIGLSQIALESALIVIGWLIILGVREQQKHREGLYFNVMQIGLGFWTLLALILLYTAVHHGLLESPDMQIAGNQSTAFNLNWYQDRSGAQLPTATVLMLPLTAYRIAMLLWSLWLAVSLLKWLKWGWDCFSSGGLWKSVPLRKKPVAAESENQP